MRGAARPFPLANAPVYGCPVPGAGQAGPYPDDEERPAPAWEPAALVRACGQPWAIEKTRASSVVGRVTETTVVPDGAVYGMVANT